MFKYTRIVILIFSILSGLAVILIINYFGLSYYLTPLKDKFFHVNHLELKPGGSIGHGLGIIGSFLMLTGVFSYMIRKRNKKLHRMGKLKYWLEVHIFLCLFGPMLVLYHTAFKFGGIVSVSFWSMTAVVISGFIGRFIYLQIPRSIEGNELSFDEINKLNIDLSLRLREMYGVNEDTLVKVDEFTFAEDKINITAFNFLFVIIQNYFTNRRVLNEIKSDLRSKNLSKENIKQVLQVCKTKLVLSRRNALLKTIQRLFKYWHVAHLPFAILMLVIMLVHVGVTIAFGYQWIF